MANDNYFIIRSIILSQFILWPPTYDLHTAAIIECRWQIRGHFHSQNLDSLSLQAMCTYKFFCHQDGSSRAVRCRAALELSQRTIDARWVHDLLHTVIFLKLWITIKKKKPTLTRVVSLLFDVQHLVSMCAQSGWPGKHSVFSALTSLPSNWNTSDSPLKVGNLKSPVTRCSKS